MQVKVVSAESWDVAQRLSNAELKVLYTLSKHSLADHDENPFASAISSMQPVVNADFNLKPRKYQALNSFTAHHQSSYIVKFYDAFFDPNQKG